MAHLEALVHHHDCLIELFDVGNDSRKQQGLLVLVGAFHCCLSRREIRQREQATGDQLQASNKPMDAVTNFRLGAYGNWDRSFGNPARDTRPILNYLVDER